MRHRLTFAVAAFLVDAVLLVGCYFAAFELRANMSLGRWLRELHVITDWSLAVILGAVLLSFSLQSLYTRESFIFRPLQLRTIIKASMVAFVAAALVVYLVKSPAVQQSRFVLVFTFVFFIIADSLVRIFVFCRLYAADVRRKQPLTLVIGKSLRADLLLQRLRDLKGFADYRQVDLEGLRAQAFANGSANARPQLDAEGSATAPPCEGLEALFAAAAKEGRTVGSVFIATLGVPLEDAVPLAGVGKRHGAEVYMLSDLLRPLHRTRLLFYLLEAPVVRVTGDPNKPAPYFGKRAFDLIAGCVALLLLALPLLVIAIAVKLGSRGPVIYRQERIGQEGRTFTFYKFRTMIWGNRSARHEQYTRDFIAATPGAELNMAERAVSGGPSPSALGSAPEPDPVYKLLDDDRVTPVGRFLRRYSLDELPQLWNVIKGDMSLVGPRPALPYEVEVYKDWHRARLRGRPGVTGVWQIGGRSRVAFDEMVVQDLFYEIDQSMLLDAFICLKTVPAALTGRGAA